MGLAEVVGTVQVHCSRRRLLRRGLEFHMCLINKSAHTKKSLETYLIHLVCLGRKKDKKFDHSGKWYIHKQESVQGNEMHEIIQYFDVETDHPVKSRKPNICCVTCVQSKVVAWNNSIRNCCFQDTKVSCYYYFYSSLRKEIDKL